MKSVKYVPFGSVVRQVREEVQVTGRRLELMKPNDPTIRTLVTGKPTRHNLVTFPKAQPLVINGREFTRLGIAKAVGCDIGHISKVFAGLRTPSLFMARKIASVIGLTTDQFYDLLTRLDVGQEVNENDRTRRPATFQPITGNL